MHKARLKLLIKKLDESNIDALLITKPENIFYLTCFLSTKTILVVTPKKNIVMTDFIYEEAAAKAFKNAEIIVTKDSFVGSIAGVLRKYKIKKLGFESSSLNFSRYRYIKRTFRGRIKLVPTENIIEAMREIKDAKEILALKKVLTITAETLKDVKTQLRPEFTELAVAKLIKSIFIKRGADGFSFEPIVATQPSSSQPHYLPARKKLGNNKVVLLDMGAKLSGYNSDLTRMCPLGKISSKFAKLYAVVLDAQRRAIECIRPGARIKDVDSAARQHIASKGLGKFFGHGLGHGIGLETHENPSISHHSKDLLKEGMVFTIEPGIYIPGYGGLRVEETIVVRRGGCKVLTDGIDKSI